MSLYVVDVEADGPAPGLYSMVCFGAVKVTPELDQTFYGETCPITDEYKEDALAVSGFSREQCLEFEDPAVVMKRFDNWVKETCDGRATFISDNVAFDWQFINYYFHRFLGQNPFGWSGRRIGDVYCGMQKNAYRRWKHLRDTTHDHNPVNDAKGNAEVILKLNEMGMNFKLK